MLSLVFGVSPEGRQRVGRGKDARRAQGLAGTAPELSVEALEVSRARDGARGKAKSAGAWAKTLVCGPTGTHWL